MTKKYILTLSLKEYEDYLSLKKTIDNMHEEVMKLTYQLDLLPRHSPELKVITQPETHVTLILTARMLKLK